MRKIINWIVETFYPDLIIWGPEANPFHTFDKAAAVDPAGRPAAMVAALYIANYCNSIGATEFTGTVKGLTSSGEPCGDWQIVVTSCDHEKDPAP